MLPQIKLCPDGPSFSRLVAGYWRLVDWDMPARELVQFIYDCLDLGISTADLADIYGDYECERLFGEAMALEPALRQKIHIVTKCGIKLVSKKFPDRRIAHYDTGKEHILSAVDQSLLHLNTDHIDLLLIHRPDPLMDADEVAEAFESLKAAGKVLHFGVSNFLPLQFNLLTDRLSFPLVTNQVECSVLNFDVMHDGTLDQCQQLRTAPMAWSPLGGGRLFTSQDAQATRVRACLEDIGKELDGAGIDQVAFAWLLKHPSNMLPVLGTGKIERLRSACDSANLVLSREQWFRVWRASMGCDVP